MTDNVTFCSLWVSSFFSIISRIQFKTPLPTVQLQLPLSQPSLHSDVLFIPGTQGYQGFLSLELNSNLEIVLHVSLFWKSYEIQEHVITERSWCCIHHLLASLFSFQHTKISKLLRWRQQEINQQPKQIHYYICISKYCFHYSESEMLTLGMKSLEWDGQVETVSLMVTFLLFIFIHLIDITAVLSLRFSWTMQHFVLTQSRCASLSPQCSPQWPGMPPSPRPWAPGRCRRSPSWPSRWMASPPHSGAQCTRHPEDNYKALIKIS